MRSFNRCIPELYVTDIRRSLSFYEQLLGWEVAYSRPENRFVFLAYHGAQLMLVEDFDGSWLTGPLDEPRGRGVNLSIETPDLARLVHDLAEGGWRLFRSPSAEDYQVGADRVTEHFFLVQDPDGYLLRFVQDPDV